MQLILRNLLLPFFILGLTTTIPAQSSLLLNGNFEDINICTEYNAPCGVEGWFYLNEVKAQMLDNENNASFLGSNSFALFYNWLGYSGFTPVIGTLLPCGLQKNNRYTFKGILSARLNPRLNLKPGICLGERFYVPKRVFAKTMKPDSIVSLKPLPNSLFFEFEYSFVADGTEKYLTFGTFIEEDTSAGKRKLIGSQTVSLVLDNFQLLPEDKRELPCPGFMLNKDIIYNYNFRHKEMDYSLFARGDLPIGLNKIDSNYVTRIKELPPPPLKPDTLKLGDVFFDFNKASLKPGAIKMLEAFFLANKGPSSIDSVYAEGHTDSIGSDSRNLQLSQRRCESIRTWLQQNNVLTSERIQIHPFGRSRPVSTNSTPQGRALNRRVEIIVFRKLQQ